MNYEKVCHENQNETKANKQINYKGKESLTTLNVPKVSDRKGWKADLKVCGWKVTDGQAEAVSSQK